MALTGQNILVAAVGILQDPNHATWPEADLLTYLNEGTVVITGLKPDVYPTNAAVKLAAGAKQAIPAGGIALVDILYNMGTAGTTPGNPITLVDRAIMSAALPGWLAATADATVKHWMYDQEDPKTFYVYPPQPASNQGYVQMIYSKPPNAIAIGAAIPLDDAYGNALVNFILYKAWLKKQPALAQGYWSLFLSCLGLREAEEDKSDPNARPAKGGTR